MYSYLKKIHKHLVDPVLYYTDTTLGCGGLYYHPNTQPLLIDNKEISLEKGCIVIPKASVNEEDIEENLAHEWRHHWQYYNGWDMSYKRTYNFTDYDTYEDQIKKYFTENIHEFDALMFTIKYGGKAPIANYFMDIYLNGS